MAAFPIGALSRVFEFLHSETALTPTFTLLKDFAGNSLIGSAPTVNSIGLGLYDANFSALFSDTSVQGLIFEIDGGASVTDEGRRYLRGTVERDEQMLKLLYDVQVGRWNITGNQLLMYDADDNLILTFDLKNSDGDPTETRVFQRVPA